MKPTRIQRKRSKGWRMPENAIYVGRPTKWGNPFVVGRDGTTADCLRFYVALAQGLMCCSVRSVTFAQQERAHRAMKQAATELRGKDLACFCSLSKPCHADVLLELANAHSQPDDRPNLLSVNHPIRPHSRRSLATRPNGDTEGVIRR